VTDLPDDQVFSGLPDNTYELPAHMSEYSDMFSSILASLMGEMEGVDRPISTYDRLLLERCASYYVFIRAMEATEEEGEGFAHTTAHLQANKFWKEISEEFERRFAGNDVERVLRVVQSSLMKALSSLEESQRKHILGALSAALADAGL